MKKNSKELSMEFERALLAWVIRLEARLEALEHDSHPEKIFVMPGEFETKMEEIEKRFQCLESRVK